MNERAIKVLKSGGVGVLLTDTLYGLVGQALSKEAVSRIYKLKRRNTKKPLIILISSINDLGLFGVNVDAQTKKILQSFWPGRVSIILTCKLKKFSYLHRNTGTLAFRLPKKKSLIELIKKTGPLVAPSANPEGEAPAKNITEAVNYFGDQALFYLGRGKPKDKPSTIVSVSNGGVEFIRK